MLNYFWFRRDLRLDDNAALYYALKSGATQPIFIFDTTILDSLPANDARVQFIYNQISKIQDQLVQLGTSLHVHYGNPQQIWTELLTTNKITAIYTNRDYEPQAIARDAGIKSLASQFGTAFYDFKDQCIFEQHEVVKDNGEPYTVFTPYSKKWKAKLTDFYLKSYPSLDYVQHFIKQKPQPIITLKQMGFDGSNLVFPEQQTTVKIIKEYAQNRDMPSLNATSMLSVHFRFGTISVRQKVKSALPLSETWVNELIWREFYMQILYHFPHAATSAFRPIYNRIDWLNQEQDFEKWKKGKTGYPLVDAGMRQLNTTGFMHNRVRMVVASFLTKHLLIDWRWGEAYFAEKLLDFELASNNGGWQWAAGSGVDAAPYFRIFNPHEQQKKFDPTFQYIKKYVPEWGTPLYPQPMVDHATARKRCLEVYKVALKP